MNKTCPNCNAIKPSWSTHRLCPKCRRNENDSIIKVGDQKPINSRGQEVIVKHSNQVINVTRRRDSMWRHSAAYVTQRAFKNDGALTSYSTCIYLNPYMRWTPERLAQTFSAESIHLAMFALGMGKENSQFDKFGLHSWATVEDCIEEYYGVSIKKHGLLQEG